MVIAMSRGTVIATVPAAWLAHHIGRKLWCRPYGGGDLSVGYHELVHVDFLGQVLNADEWWAFRGWVRHKGSVSPVRLPQVCTVAGIPAEETRELVLPGSPGHLGAEWIKPDGDPPRVPLSDETWQNPRDFSSPWRGVSRAPVETKPASDGALFDL